MKSILRILAFAFGLIAPLAHGQFATPPTWENLTETERYFINRTITSDTTQWTYTKAVSYATFERAPQFVCGMFLRNQGFDRANALLILQAHDAQFCHDKTDGTKGMSEFGGIGYVAVRAFFGNLFDAATNASVDHALQYMADWAYRPGTDNGRNPDWLNFAAMNAVVLEYCGAVYNNATWTSAATTRWDGIYAAVKRNNCDPEYNSPTYEAVSLSALGIGAKACQSAAVRAKALEMKNLLWSSVAKHYNASMRNSSGPYYRTYGDGMDLMGPKIAAYTQDLVHSTVTTNPAGHIGGGTVCLDAVSGQTSPGDVPAASAAALFEFQGNRRLITTFQHTYTTYNYDVAIEEDRMAAVINSYSNPYNPSNAWDPFGYPADQLVMTALHWKSGIADDDKSLAFLKIYNSSYYRSRFNAEGDIEVLLDRVGTSYPLRFKATSTTATPAVISGTRWDMPGQSFEVVTSLPSPTVTVAGAETTILYDTTAAATNSVVFTLKYVKAPTHNWLGGQFKTATLLEASSAGASNSAGLYVTGMPTGSAGYTAGLRAKDIITTVNGQAVKYPEDLFRAIRAAGSGSVSVKVRRSAANQTVNLGSGVAQAVAINATLKPAYAWRNSRGGIWSTAMNWRTGAVPVTAGGDTVSFADADLIFDATLNLDANPTVGSLLFGDVLPSHNWQVNGSGSFVLAPATGTPVIEVVNQTTELAVPLQSSLGFRKQGAGRLLLAATNNYTGTTTVAAGTLQFATPGAFQYNTPASWTAANLVVENGATAAFNVGGLGEFTVANMDILKSLGTDTGGFKNGSALGFDTTNDADGVFTYNSLITAPNAGANSMGITKHGDGTLILTAANTYTGDTTVAEGTLVADTTSKLGTGNLTVASGAGCELRNPSGALATTASVNLSNGAKLNLATGVSQTVTNLYINGVWQVSGTWNAARDSVHFSGTGSLIVTGGPINVPVGLAVTPGNSQVSLSWTAIAGATSYTVKRATVSGGPYTILGTTATAAFTDSAVTNGQTYYYIVSSTVDGVESFPSAEGAATPSPNVWTGASSTAWETLGNWNTAVPTSSSIAVFAGSLTTNQPSVTASNSVGGLLFESPGWTLNSASSGTLTIGANGLVVNANSGTITLNKTVTILAGTTRFWKGKTGSTLVLATIPGAPTGTTGLQWGDTTDAAYQGTLKLTFTGNGPNIPIIVSGGILQAHKTGWINSRDLTVNGGTFLVTNSNGDLLRDTYGVTLSSGLANWNGFSETLAALTLNGGVLRGSNSTLSINDSTPAKITVTDDISLGDAADVSKLKLARSGSTGICDLSGGKHSLTVHSTVELALPVTNGNLIKQGAGTLILSSTAALSGETAIGGGTLEVDGTLNLSDSLESEGGVTVNSGATLSGTGTINGPVTVGGNLTPGVSGTGTLRIANSLTFSADSITTVSLKRTGTPNCTGITGATSVTFNGTLTVVNTSGTLALGDRFVLFSSGTFSGAFTSVNLPALDPGLTWDTSALAVDGSISVINLPLAACLRLHLDASNATSMVLDANNRVSRWNDADGGTNYAAQTTGTLQPTSVVDPTLGRSVVDFGPLVSGATGKWLQFKDSTGTNLNISTIRSVVIVMKGGNHILGDDNNYHFHRGSDFVSGTSPLWSNSYTSTFIKNGQTYLNGGATPINGTTTAMPAGYWLASVITSGPVEASRLACDRTARSGGQQIAEVLIYDRPLTDAERQATETSLMQKWFADQTPPVITVPPAMTMEATGNNGAVVSFTTSATDNIDGSVATVNSPASGSTFPLGSTTVTATAVDAAGNTASKSFTVTVTRSFAWFQGTYGLSGVNPAADTGQGMPYLTAYAFGINPNAPDRSLLPTVTCQNGFLQISYQRYTDATDLTYVVEVSADLHQWNSGPGYTQQVSVSPIDASRQHVVERDKISTTNAIQRFIRIRLVK